MTVPSPEQIRTLAPDASAARAAESLADPRRWSAAGRGASAAWGLCQGSGSTPYQVAVDLGDPGGSPAYSCSCPSRKIPCKHALGLLFLLAGGGVATDDPPGWAFDWLASRATRAATAAQRAAERPAEVDAAARARRIERREQKVLAGIDELDRWLGDLMRRGLDSARSEGYRFWDAMGARLVDAQAAGLGRSVRGLGWAANAGEAWPHLLLEGTARLHLLTEAYRRADTLPEPLRADVRSLVGWTTKEDELTTDDEVEDRWLVVGRRVNDSGQVMTARTFLLGEDSGRFALHLAFGVDTAPPTVLAHTGQAFRARLAFYPSATPLRAAVRPVITFDGEVAAIPAAQGVDAAVAAHAARLGANPFAGAWPVAIEGVIPVLRDDRLLVRDVGGRSLRVDPAWLAPRMLAASGGRPVTVVGEWDGSTLRPLSLLAGGRLISLDAGEGGTASFRDGDPAWSQLVSAALLGTERTGGTVPVPDAAAPLVQQRERERALLASAAVLAVRRRAGRRPEHDTEPVPSPAPDDEWPALVGDAARMFEVVVRDEPALLVETLALLRISGRRPPDEWLPELFAFASRNADVREAARGLLGVRARWLVERVPPPEGETAPVEPLSPGAGTAAVDWDAALEGAPGAAARVRVLEAYRAADPAAARDAIRRGMATVRGDERAAVVGALRTRLEDDDEPLLRDALVDTRVDVRRAAAQLLVLLPASTLTRALEATARSLVGLDGTRTRLALRLPSAEDVPESIAGRPQRGVGERSWLLRQLVAHVRPIRWAEWTGLDARALVDAARRADEASAVLAGWIDAAVRFGDPGWLSAVAADPKAVAASSVDLPAAVGALPPEDRAPVAAVAAASVDPVVLARLAASCPAPWPPALATAFVEAAKPLATVQFPDPSLYELVRVAARGMPPAMAEELAELASWQGQVRPALGGALDTIRLRARIHEAFAALSPAQGEG